MASGGKALSAPSRHRCQDADAADGGEAVLQEAWHQVTFHFGVIPDGGPRSCAAKCAEVPARGLRLGFGLDDSGCVKPLKLQHSKALGDLAVQRIADVAIGIHAAVAAALNRRWV